MSSNFSYTITECSDKATLEDQEGETFAIPRAWLPSSAKAGDKIAVTTNEWRNRGQVWFTVTQHR